ncbi:unnamed protein product [Didymodactylos carnosus]|uniref:Uncharacterized protein n=1 Tax=Didymodactylos carnosus TaxID=1234261 RepID=A0A815RP09_9BILA|nr:unnamed protein product [Didymodactylos carnosus]CAF1479601.1 unnamed protein product [Didymodactylos carnosus]CAF3797051.1 unnamed protein product [Didymodactylos carnosus]CAF4345010.1 unnamed protein product [Didymodactylos carnosus]
MTKPVVTRIFNSTRAQRYHHNLESLPEIKSVSLLTLPKVLTAVGLFAAVVTVVVVPTVVLRKGSNKSDTLTDITPGYTE